MANHRIRIYVSDWHLTPEQIQDVFRSHGDLISEDEAVRFGEFLDYKDPVLAAGLPDWDIERGNPFFHAWQAFAEDYPSVRIPVIEPWDTGNLQELVDKGLSLRKIPFHEWVGVEPHEIVKNGVLLREPFKRPHLERKWLTILSYELDGFQAYRLLSSPGFPTDRLLSGRPDPTDTEIGIYPTLEAALEKADSSTSVPTRSFEPGP
ncbi:hypothetical protein [Leptospirillum ferriphilum]|uniref:hypothetical protein n=1 Tax=Leptospirillum ferriphilum TaxID=178606 RepID=UPI0006B16188|nr:hypothetical protein [Leptospirillum ferriphilum]